MFGLQLNDGGASIGTLGFESDDTLKLNNKVSASTGFEAKTNMLFRDTSAWYHVFISFNGNESTHNDRADLYINGVQQTWQGSGSLSSGNGLININNTHSYGHRAVIGGQGYDGMIAQAAFVDGDSTLAVTDFGRFDTTTGIWTSRVPNVSTWGTNGHFLKFENSGSIGTDSSGNGNNFSVGSSSGTILQSRSTPTNVFNTISRVDYSANPSQIQKNCTRLNASGGGGDIATRGIFGVNSGKWYWECKSIISTGTGNRKMVGFYDGNSPVGNGRALSSYKGVLVNLRTGDVYKDGSTSGTTNISSFSSGDIVGVFFDADNGEMRFSKNGTMENSGNAVATGVDMSNYLYLPYISQDGGGSNNGIMDCNFGEGYFASTAVSSGNADANGYGQFEYNPVVSGTNYYALCTKNMEQY